MSVSDFDDKPDKKWVPMFKKVISNKIPHLTERLQEALVSEEGIKHLFSELIPKEVLGNIMGQVGSIREDLLEVFQKELRNRLDKVDVAQEMDQILTNFDVVVEAKIRLTPKSPTKAPNGPPKKKRAGK